MKRKFTTKTIRWDITAKCNLACNHCYIPRTEATDLETSAIIRILSIALSNGLRELNLSGREPTMRHDLPQIIEWCQSHNVRVNIVTNGTLVDKKILLSIIDGLSIIAYSLDGPNATIHNRLRGNGTFDKTMQNITQCVNYAKRNNHNISIGISSTLTKYNHLHIAEMVELGESLGIDYLAINPVIFCGSANLSKAALNLQNQEISCAFEKICMVYAKVKPSFRLHLGILPKEAQLLNLKYDLDLPVVQNGCIAGTTVYITPDGKAYPCYMLPPIAQVMSSMKKYLQPWNIQEEPISYALRYFTPFLNFIGSNSQENNRICMSCEDKPICKPCPLLAKFDSESLKRCSTANKQIASLMPNLQDSMVPTFRENVQCDIKDNSAIFHLKRTDYASKKIYEVNALSRYLISLIRIGLSVFDIRTLVVKKYRELPLHNVYAQLRRVLLCLWKDRIIYFRHSDD